MGLKGRKSLYKNQNRVCRANFGKNKKGCFKEAAACSNQGKKKNKMWAADR